MWRPWPWPGWSSALLSWAGRKLGSALALELLQGPARDQLPLPLLPNYPFPGGTPLLLPFSLISILSLFTTVSPQAWASSGLLALSTAFWSRGPSGTTATARHTCQLSCVPCSGPRPCWMFWGELPGLPVSGFWPGLVSGAWFRHCHVADRCTGGPLQVRPGPAVGVLCSPQQMWWPGCTWSFHSQGWSFFSSACPLAVPDSEWFQSALVLSQKDQMILSLNSSTNPIIDFFFGSFRHPRHQRLSGWFSRGLWRT